MSTNLKDAFNRAFFTWESHTAEIIEHILRNGAVVDALAWLTTAVMRQKVMVDRTLVALWRALMLPNKRDQERTLHELREIQSKHLDLLERLTDMQACLDRNFELKSRDGRPQPGIPSETH